MSKGIMIIGTDTDVGKTVVAGGLMHLLLKKGCQAAYFKPVASGDVTVAGVSVPADPAFVEAVSGFHEARRLVTPCFYADSLAPHLAARLAGRPVDPAVILKSLDDLKKRYEVIVAEAAGGLMVPLNDEGFLQCDLIRALGFPCLLVARAGLGTINHTLLTLRAARDRGLNVRGIVINNAGDSLIETDNIAMIRKLAGVDGVFVLPRIDDMEPDRLRPGKIRDVFERAIEISGIVAMMEDI